MPTTIQIYKWLIWITLYGSALHFFDNVYFFDQYPEPAWLTAPLVAVLWIPLALMAHRAVDRIYTDKVNYSFSLVHAFVLANWISLGHYLFASPVDMLPRINFAIALQVFLATILLAYTLWIQFTTAPDSLKYSRRVWLQNGFALIVVIVVLEFFWPSNFSDWWYA